MGTKSHSSGPEMHGNAKTSAENSERYVGKPQLRYLKYTNVVTT